MVSGLPVLVNKVSLDFRLYGNLLAFYQDYFTFFFLFVFKSFIHLECIFVGDAI